jgi:hypothetical protein
MVRGTLTLSRILTLGFMAVVSFQCLAQTSNKEHPSPRDLPKIKTLSKSREAVEIEQAQRTTAIWIITSLVSESERYADQSLRVRTQARSADALWNVDETMARNLFLQAWKTAEKVDEATGQASQEARKSALRSHGVTMVPPAASLRSEVLSLAARRDPGLGNLFISKLDEAKEQENGSTDQTLTSSQYPDPTEPRLAIAKRLEVALQLLSAGDIKQAKAFAEPALGFATSPGIIFLCALRQKDLEGADKQYARLLARAAIDPDADATTVSLLSSYVLTPTYLVTATRHGRVSNQFSDAAQSYDASPELRTRFFSVAAKILLRPPQPSDEDPTVAGRAGTYFTIARLLPMFEKYAASYVPALNTQLAMLSQDAPETFRNGQDAMLRVGLVNEAAAGDTIPAILDQLAVAASSAERDTLYVKAIREGAPKGDPRIRQFAGKIEDDNLRGLARSFTDFVVVRRAINERDAETALGIVRNGYLTSLHRVWAIGEIVRLTRNTDSAGAIDLLEDANAEAHRIAIGESDRVYALSCVATAFFAVDHFRSWSVASDAIKAANAVPGFTGDDTKLYARLRSRNLVSMISEDEASFSIANLFRLLAKDDLQLALSTADGLSGEPSRATASLAVARSILDKQKARGTRR